MSPSEFTERLKNEALELNNRIEKLHNFLNSDKFIELTDYHQKLLVLQFNYMSDYSNVLSIRLELLEKYPNENTKPQGD